MRHKFTILLSLATLLSGILASQMSAVFATHYDGEYYGIAEIAALRQQYVAEVKSSCGAYSSSSSFSQCVTNTYTKYSDTYGGLGMIMRFISSGDGAIMLSSINPAAETIRFYTDTVGGFKSADYEYENLFIFWLDWSASASVRSSDNSNIQAYMEPLLAGETPQGVHLLYSSQRGDANWFTVGEETRVEYTGTGDFASDSQDHFVILMGYDSNHTLRYASETLSQCFSGDYISGSECDLEYYYAPTPTVGRYYTVNPATDEDLALIRYKELERVAREAEAAAREARQRATEAEQKTRDAEQSASDARAQASEAQAAAAAARERAEAAEKRAIDAEQQAEDAARHLSNLEAELATTKSQLANAESRLANTEQQLANTEQQLADTEQRLTDTESRLSDTILRLSSLESQLATMESRLAELETSFATHGELAATAIDDLTASLTASSATVEELRTLLAATREELLTAISQLTPQTTTIVQHVATAREDTDNFQPISPTSDCTSAAIASNTPEPTVPESAVSAPATSSDLPSSTHDFPWWLLLIVLSGVFVLVWWFLPLPHRSHQSAKHRK